MIIMTSQPHPHATHYYCPPAGQAVHEVSLATLRHQQAVSREHTTPPLYQADTMVVQDSALDNCPPYNVQL